MEDPVENQVREFIAERYPAGEERYITENGLAEEFAINRSTARKILLGLEGEGAVRCTPKGYIRVDYGASPREVVYELRATVERLAAGLAAARAQRRDMVELQLALEEADAALQSGDLAGYDRSDMNFHVALVEAAHDPLLRKVFSFLAWSAETPAAPDLRTVDEECRANEAHRRIFQAVKTHESERASGLVGEHLLALCRRSERTEVSPSSTIDKEHQP